MFVFLILDLNDEIFLIPFGSLDRRFGPKCLIECLPYLTVLNLDIILSSYIVLQGRVVQSWVKITQGSARFELRFESLKSISILIFFCLQVDNWNDS